MELLIESLKHVDIAQVLIILAGIWFFYHRLDTKIEKRDNKLTGEIEKLDHKIEKLDHKFTGEIEKLDSKIEKLAEKVEDVDRRLCRIEGSLSTHGHCLFNQAKPEQRAE